MDIANVSSACVSALAGVAHLSNQISIFTVSVRDARRDTDAVSREVASLSLYLEAIRDDSMIITYTESISEDLLAVLRNSESATYSMATFVEQCSARETQWDANDVENMARLLRYIEWQTCSLKIALNMNSL
jgi:hypothetical protein